MLNREYRVAVYDARFANPVDTALLRTLATQATPILTLEDHSVIGGFGAAVLEAFQEIGIAPPPVARLGLPDSFILQDSRSSQLAEAGLDAPGIAREVRALCERAASSSSQPPAGKAATARPVVS